MDMSLSKLQEMMKDMKAWCPWGRKESDMIERLNNDPGHKTSLNKFKKMEIISSIFFPKYNSMKLEINYRNKNGKRIKMWRLNNMLLEKPEVHEEIKEEIRKCPEMKMETQHSKIYGM